jgi:4-hydroxy-tetrahydrodipicolinate reductase
MKIALLGYGKMGKAIESVIDSIPQHEVILKYDGENDGPLTTSMLKEADVAIEFSTPDTAVLNIYTCFAAGVPVVVGTTGWYKHLPELTIQCEETNSTLFWASNFSIGVNIFFAVNKYLAKVMNEQEQYDVTLEEIHHTEKLDSPSGTAITLATGVLEELDRKHVWVNQPAEAEEQLSIISKREEGVPGTHLVTYKSGIDTIEISHVAHSRLGFAQGAVKAAEWVHGKQGVYTMSDMLEF